MRYIPGPMRHAVSPSASTLTTALRTLRLATLKVHPRRLHLTARVLQLPQCERTLLRRVTKRSSPARRSSEPAVRASLPTRNVVSKPPLCPPPSHVHLPARPGDFDGVGAAGTVLALVRVAGGGVVEASRGTLSDEPHPVADVEPRDQRGVDGPDAAGGAKLDNGAAGEGVGTSWSCSAVNWGG